MEAIFNMLLIQAALGVTKKPVKLAGFEHKERPL
jgi:hypothetical protein